MGSERSEFERSGYIPRKSHAVSPQVAKLIEQTGKDDPELGRLLHLAASTGARRGELCALRWSDVDTELATLTIERSIIEVPGGLAEKDTKTHAARRIALDPGTL